MLQIAVMNESCAISDDQVNAMQPAFYRQWNDDLQLYWGVQEANFTFIPKGQAPAEGTWWVVFLDDSDQASALAYHDLTDDGLPVAKIFVKTIRAANASVSVGGSHEICEMAVDPYLNSAYQGPDGVFWAGEICDPVEDDEYGYKIGDILVTDFVTPNWFAHQHTKGKIDAQGHTNAAYEILTGGYAQKFDTNSGWQQVTGSKARRGYRAHAPQGSRRERRKRIGEGEILERSRVRMGAHRK